MDPLLISDVLTPAECSLLQAFDLSFAEPSVAAPTGDPLQDRLMYEMVRRDSLLDPIEQLLGPNILLWQSRLSRTGDSLLPASEIARGHALWAAIVIAEPSEMTTIRVDRPGERISLSYSVKAGSVLLCDASHSMRSEQAPDDRFRVLTFGLCAPETTVATERGQVVLSPYLELRGRGGQGGAIPSPRRGPRSAWAIPESYIQLSDRSVDGLLLDGHTDVCNLLRVWDTEHSNRNTPLTEALSLALPPAGGEATMRYRALGRASATPSGGRRITIEWASSPLGHKSPLDDEALNLVTGVDTSTVHLSRLRVEQRFMGGDEHWAEEMTAADTILIVVDGVARINGRVQKSPAIAILPAGTATVVEAIEDRSVRLVTIHLTGPVTALADVAPAAEDPLRGPGSDLVYFCIPSAPRRATRDWTRVCRLLDATLRSIYAQTDPNWRVVVVGNEAPDLTLPLDDRFEFLATRRDSGSGDYNGAEADAWQKRMQGEKRALERGAQYVFFVDSDDLLNRDVVAHIRRTRHPFGYVVGRGFVFDAEHRRLAPLPLSTSEATFDEHSSSCAAFNVGALNPIIASEVARYGHMRYRERMYLSGRPLSDISFPAVTYVRFTSENLSDAFTPLPERKDRDTAFISQIDSESLPLTGDLLDQNGLRPLLEEPRPVGRTFGPKRLSVLICTHNRPDGLAGLLETLIPQTRGHPDREIVVVNDGTHNDRYAEILAQYSGLVRYEPLPRRVGIAEARNRSAALALGEYLVFTDDDCEVPDWWLDWLDARLNLHPELDVIAGTAKPLRPESANFFGRVQAHYRKTLPFPEDLGSGEQRFVTACLAVRAALFRRVGGFGEHRIFSTAGEDTELSARLVAQGARTRIDLDWTVNHALSRGMLEELGRRRRYGRASGMMARMGMGPMALRRQQASRMSGLPARFWRHVYTYRAEPAAFPGQPVRSWLARLIMALMDTSYEYGVAEGRRRPLERS